MQSNWDKVRDIQRYEVSIFEICNAIHGQYFGSGVGNYSNVALRKMGTHLRERLDDWEPSTDEKYRPYDMAVRRLMSKSYEEYLLLGIHKENIYG